MRSRQGQGGVQTDDRYLRGLRSESVLSQEVGNCLHGVRVRIVECLSACGCLWCHGELLLQMKVGSFKRLERQLYVRI